MRLNSLYKYLERADGAVVSVAAGVQVQACPGSIRCNISELLQRHGGEFVNRLMERTLWSGVIRSVAVDFREGALTIEYDRRSAGLPQALEAIALSLRGSHSRKLDLDVAIDRGDDRLSGDLVQIDRFRHYPPVPTPSDSPSCALVSPAEALHQDSPFASGWKRAVNLGAAGGCFLLAIVGFVMPGIPTIPFVLGTSHFLVRSTPSLNDKLRRSRLFGRLISDWEDQGGLRRSTKTRAIVLLCLVVGVSLRTASSPPLLATTLAMVAIDLWIVLRLPTIPEQPAARPALLPACS